MENIWVNKLVSFAYQYQREASPFVDMMNVFKKFLASLNPQRVMDVGCGSGRIMRLLLDDLEKKPNEIVAIDISQYALRYAKKNLQKHLGQTCVSFAHLDISDAQAFSSFQSDSFDLVTAGLSLQYAEHKDQNGRWTRKRYIDVFTDLHNCLKPGGKLVFSVNVPNPDFSVIAKESKKVIFSKWRRTPLLLFVAIVMVKQGKKLTQMANEGRYHYLPIEHVVDIVSSAGYENIIYEKTYADLAWVVSCEK